MSGQKVNNSYILNDNEKQQISKCNISENSIYEQLNIFNNGTSFSNITKPATLADGIVCTKNFTKERLKTLNNKYKTAKETGRFLKFVPASGAATRMFKNLLSFQNSDDNNDSILSLDYLEQNKKNLSKDEKELLYTLKNIKKFAFYNDLSKVLEKDSINIDQLIKNEKW